MNRLFLSRVLLTLLAGVVVWFGVKLLPNLTTALSFSLAVGLIWPVENNEIEDISLIEITKKCFYAGLFFTTVIGAAIFGVVMLTDVSFIVDNWLQAILSAVFLMSIFMITVPAFGLNLYLKRWAVT